MRVRTAGIFIATIALSFGCKSSSSDEGTNEAAKVAAPAAVEEAEPTAQARAAEPMGTSGRHRAMGDWVPAEYKSGKGRWKSAGVYVDGKPVGMLWFGELPRSLETVWEESVEGLDFKPGDKGPRERVTFERRFRVADYLESVGVDVRKVKEVHLYGGGGHIARVPGNVLRKFKESFLFAFGRGTSGKAIPLFPTGMPVNTMFDRIVGVTVYIDKKPPVINEEHHAYVDGRRVTEIPYFGEPLRGGIRVYKDDVLVGIVKRNKLAEDATYASKKGDEVWYRLMPVLKDELGIELDDVVAVEVLRDERREEIFDAKSLGGVSFHASSQMQGAILLDDPGETVVESLALYSKKIKPWSLPEPPAPIER